MTSKDYLSQEEIDALLKQSSEDTSSSSSGPTIEEFLTLMEQDALGEIGNITFGSAATALSTLLGKKVDITTPQVSIIASEELVKEFPKPHVAVSVRYVDGFQGINSLVIKTRDAQVIADLMLGGEGAVDDSMELNEIHISAVQEAMNQMMGSSATSMSTIFNRFVNISPPGIDILNLADGEGAGTLPPEDYFIKISFRLKIGELIDSTIMQLLPVHFAKEMVSILMGGGSTEPSKEESNNINGKADYDMPDEAIYNGNTVNHGQQQPEYMSQTMQAAPQQHSAHPSSMQQPAATQMQNTGGFGGMSNNRNVNVQPVQFSNLTGGFGAGTEETNLGLLLDIPLKVTVELGRTQKVIKDILELSLGSIIELDKLAGEPVDILVNNKLIAKGEVVVIDENFGVRVTDIVSQWDRIQKLQ
ncbi:flagellar motor switch protein FliN [Paenibacillus swuensis]|uniref:Flagellar motor switch protein FliN n=1 Tax=Paenibacillus swuensis TaxID=1178515 RepID=A0A172TKH7_9BACL|nr:flagellar motor switch phosphatase FliY [Paenibacillus swuensis]ANE47548.1 flagellar motor switch protein FliN [Paenibacillus swuensis]